MKEKENKKKTKEGFIFSALLTSSPDPSSLPCPSHTRDPNPCPAIPSSSETESVVLAMTSDRRRMSRPQAAEADWCRV